MTQDFARRRRQQSKKNPRFKSSVPGWVWLFTGSVMGAFVMFLVYLAGIAPQAETEEPGFFSDIKIFNGEPENQVPVDIPADPVPIEVSKPIPGPATNDDGVQITFHERFKDYEIVPTEKPLDRAEVEREKNYSCSLQVASFPTAEDADRARAQLILLNLAPRIEPGTTRSQRPIFRIKIGPFDSKAKLDAVRPALYNNGYDDHFTICQK